MRIPPISAGNKGLALAILVAAAIAQASTIVTDSQIADLVRRLQTLTAKESLRPRIDTELRLAELLEGVQPELSAKFLEQAVQLAAGHQASPSKTSPSNDKTHRVQPMPAQLSGSERRSFIADALAFIRTLDTGRQHGPLIELLNWVEESKLDREAVQPVAAQLLYIVEHTTEDPDDYARLSLLRRKYDMSVGSDNASVRARDALAQLAELVSTGYDFSLSALDGQPVTLKQQRGRVVVLAFWATWCAPCLEELSLLEKLYRENLSKGLVLLAVSDEEAETVRAFTEQNGYTFPIVIDRARTLFGHYSVEGLPASRIIDRAGRLRAEVGRIDAGQLKKLLEMVGL